MMTCEERRDLMLLYVTGALEPAEAAEVRGHLLSGCPACAGALAEAEATVHRIPESLEPVAVPGGAWERIEKRIAVKEKVAPVRVTATTGKVFVPWFVAAAAMVGVVALGMSLYVQHHDMEQMRAQLANAGKQLEADQTAMKATGDALMETRTRVADLERQMKDAGAENQKLQLANEEWKKGMDRHLTMLLGADQFTLKPMEQPQVQAKVFANSGTREWMVCCSNLKMPPEGKTYELWVIKEGQKPMPAGTFMPDKSGMAMHETKVPAEVGGELTAAVTIEPEGGRDTPTMPIQFAGAVRQD